MFLRKQIDYSVNEIYDKIFVYRALMPDAQMLHDILIDLYENMDGKNIFSKWSDWYEFGRKSDVNSDFNFYDKYHFNQTYKESDNRKKLLQEFYLFSRLAELSEKAITHYVQSNNVPIPDDVFVTSPNPAKYNENFHNNEYGYSMNFHTDYNIGEWWWPGDKFLLTCTSYINDNYKGGEIVFFVDNKIIPYKPGAGEIIVFPSGDPLYPGNRPYFHGVKVIEEGDKFLIRNYLKYSTDQNLQVWQEKEKQYGKEEWYEMARLDAQHKSIMHFEDICEDGNIRKYPRYSELVRELYKM